MTWHHACEFERKQGEKKLGSKSEIASLRTKDARVKGRAGEHGRSLVRVRVGPLSCNVGLVGRVGRGYIL